MDTHVEHRQSVYISDRQAVSEQGAQLATVIRPPQGWQRVDVGELWRFRELIYFLTWRDVKVRYKQTVLGAAWALLQPLLMMVVFTIFFGRLGGMEAKGKEAVDLPYPVFVYAGLLPWMFFSAAITAAGNSVIDSERLITKIYFPRLAIPFASVGAIVVDSAMAFVLLLALMGCYGILPGGTVLLAPVIFGAVILAALGVGTLLAALNVAYRDFRYVIPFLVQVWMFATPTIYMQRAAGGSWLHGLLALNPLTGLVAAFRAAALGGPLDWAGLGISSGCALLLFVAGCLYFRKVEDSFADVI